VLVEEAIDCVALQAGEKGVELFWQIAPELPPGFTGDVTRLRQILVQPPRERRPVYREGRRERERDPGAK